VKKTESEKGEGLTILHTKLHPKGATTWATQRCQCVGG